MFCSKCGRPNNDSSLYCTSCGAPLQSSSLNAPKKAGLGVATLVLGIIGLLAWIIPIIGLPIGILALVFGIIGIKNSYKGMSIAGLVLGSICLVLTIINGAVGAYMGFHGTAWFQQTEDIEYEEEIKESVGNNDYVFTLRDSDNNVLMTGGIKKAEAVVVEDSNGNKDYCVSIVFTKSASEEFAEITEQHIGEQIAIYLNDDMLSNPMVNAAITDGRCQISGVYSYKEAEELATLLNACKE